MYFDQNVRCKLTFPALKTFHTKANNPLLFRDSPHKLFRFRIRDPSLQKVKLWSLFNQTKQNSSVFIQKEQFAKCGQIEL